MKKLLSSTTLAFMTIAVIGQTNTVSLKVPPPEKAQMEGIEVQKNTPLKSGGEVFWSEEFDWGDETAPLGWRLPEDWAIEDPGDLGYNWHWNIDTLKGVYTNEPLLNSTSRHNGCLALNLDEYNSDLGHYDDYLAVNSSIVSPIIDCSEHASVLVRVEQNFRYWSGGILIFEVTNDAGVHWAEFDMKMGTLYSERVGGVAAGEKVDLYLNITDVAAGSPTVQFKITWRDSRLYYWMIDDIAFMEGWDNDLQMWYSEADYDNGAEDPEGFFYAVPKTQLSGYNFQSIVHNFGNDEQWNTAMNVQVMKNNEIIFDHSTDPYISYPGNTDTLVLDEQFVPEEFGHYQIDFDIASDVEDERPDDNHATIQFHVTDSLFSRCDEDAELSFSTWGWYTYGHEGDIMGTWYTLKEDAEINSISAYIWDADIQSSFSLVLMGYDEESDSPYSLLSTEMIDMDSTILDNHWITLPLDKDGESEFLEAGLSYMVGIEFWNNLEFEEALETDRYSIGSDRDNYYPSGQSWFYQTEYDTWYSSGDDLLMIRMNLNDNSNIIDRISEDPLGNAALLQNYPNPFTYETTIRYSIMKSSDVQLDIFDHTGRLIFHSDEGNRPAGDHSILVDGTDLEAGIYFYTLTMDGERKTKKMVVK